MVRYGLYESGSVRSNIVSKLSFEELVFLLETNEFVKGVVKLGLFGNYISDERIRERFKTFKF